MPFSRRALVLGISASVALRSTRTSSVALNSLTELSAVEAVARMGRGELSVESYARALLARCAQMQALNAWITLEPERVLEQARACDLRRRPRRPPGPLFGLPIPIKDSVNTAQYPTTAGTPALRQFRPRHDAPIIATLRSAGAIVLGKTNLHELSFGWTSNNHAFGAVHNPYDTTRIPGGSSGGTAAAIAAHMAPLGLAEDTQGSIRVPAAMCGIAGLRPTTGRYPTHGAVPITPLFDQVGPHARSVADLALFDAVAANDHAPLVNTPLAGTRLAVIRDYWFTDLDHEVARITDAALARLREAGAVLVEARMPGLAALIEATTAPIQNHDVRLALPRYLQEFSTGISLDRLLQQASDDIRQDFRDDVLPGGPNFVSEAEYALARDRLPALKRLYADCFASTGAAAIVFPATLVPALPIGAEDDVLIDGHTVSFETAVARNISPGSTAGVPGLVLPAGLTRQGLPVALEFDAPAKTDRSLLALGLSLEQALGPLPPPP